MTLWHYWLVFKIDDLIENQRVALNLRDACRREIDVSLILIQLHLSSSAPHIRNNMIYAVAKTSPFKGLPCQDHFDGGTGLRRFLDFDQVVGCPGFSITARATSVCPPNRRNSRPIALNSNPTPQESAIGGVSIKPPSPPPVTIFQTWLCRNPPEVPSPTMNQWARYICEELCLPEQENLDVAQCISLSVKSTPGRTFNRVKHAKAVALMLACPPSACYLERSCELKYKKVQIKEK